MAKALARPLTGPEAGALLAGADSGLIHASAILRHVEQRHENQRSASRPRVVPRRDAKRQVRGEDQAPTGAAEL